MKDSTSRSNIYVIGDLSKKHAEEYWKWLEVNMEHKCSMQFEDVYEKVGGDMFDLRRVFTALDPKDELDQMIAVARIKLTSLLRPEPKIGWDMKQGEEIAELLLKNGYINDVLQNEALKHHSRDILDAMIKENVICFRPGPVWNDDLNKQETNTSEYPIVTAPTPLHLWVLKNVMKKRKNSTNNEKS